MLLVTITDRFCEIGVFFFLADKSGDIYGMFLEQRQ